VIIPMVDHHAEGLEARTGIAIVADRVRGSTAPTLPQEESVDGLTEGHLGFGIRAISGLPFLRDKDGLWRE